MTILKVAGGFTLLAAGFVCALPGVPGPGIAMMVGALLILSDHFHWAKRVLDSLRKKASGWTPSIRNKSRCEAGNGDERAP